jgi:hypothetical protein
MYVEVPGGGIARTGFLVECYLAEVKGSMERKRSSV